MDIRCKTKDVTVSFKVHLIGSKTSTIKSSITDAAILKRISNPAIGSVHFCLINYAFCSENPERECLDIILSKQTISTGQVKIKSKFN